MATKYFRNVTAAWTTNSSWSLASGGSATGTFSTTAPTLSDDVIFDANSGTCSVSSLSHQCKTFTATNYIHTITLTGNIQAQGNMTLGANMILAGSGQLQIVATSTLTTNGKVINVPLAIGDGLSTFTLTLADDCVCSRYLTLTAPFGQSIIINNNKLKSQRDFKVSGGGEIRGSTEMQFIGTNPVTMSNARLNIDTTFAGTVSSDSMGFGTNLGDTRVCTIKYTSGTVTSDLFLNSKCNLNTYGMTWNDVQISDATLVSTFSAHNITLNSFVDIGISGTYGFTCSNLYLGVGSLIKLNSGVTYSAQNIYASGQYTLNGYITSSTPGSQAYLNLGNSSYGNITYTDITDIKSVGASAYTLGGILTNATNWLNISGTSSRTVSHIFS